MGIGGQGRPNKPTTLKVLHGDQKSRINTDEPQPASGEVLPPEWLQVAHRETSEGEESALEIWNRVAPDLIDKGVLTTWDTDAFAVYCTSVVGYRRAALEVVQEGATVQGAKGVIKNPMVMAMKDYADLMNRYGAKFGLTPSDRAALAIKPNDSKGKGADRLLG